MRSLSVSLCRTSLHDRVRSALLGGVAVGGEGTAVLPEWFISKMNKGRYSWASFPAWAFPPKCLTGACNNFFFFLVFVVHHGLCVVYLRAEPSSLHPAILP